MMIGESADMATRYALVRTCKRLHFVIEPGIYRDNIRHHDAWVMGWAAVHGQLGTLRKGLARGANIHANYSSVPRRRPRRRWSPFVRHPLLHYASKHGHDNVVEFLLDHKVNLNKKAFGLCGCSWSFLYAFNDVDIPNDNTVVGVGVEWTALHLAICHGHLSTARLLLNRDAIPESDTEQRMLERRFAVFAAIASGQPCLVDDIVREEIDLQPMREIHGLGGSIAYSSTRKWVASELLHKEINEALIKLAILPIQTRGMGRYLEFQGDTPGLPLP